MSTLLNSDSCDPASSLVEAGTVFYERELRAILEPGHSGKFVAIEPLSRQYFLGATATDALIAARQAMPNSLFFLTRVGGKSTHKIGSHGSRIR